MNRARLKRRLVKATRYEFRYATPERGRFSNVAMLPQVIRHAHRLHGFPYPTCDQITFRRFRRGS